MSDNLLLKDLAQKWHTIISFQNPLVSTSHKVKPQHKWNGEVYSTSSKPLQGQGGKEEFFINNITYHSY